MTTPLRALIATWVGLGLVALFFYPLVVALDADVFYMQWRPGDTYETLCAGLVLWAFFAAVVFALWNRRDRAGTAGLGLVVLLPLASFAAGLARQLPFEDALIAAWQGGPLRYAAPAAAAAAGLLFFLRWPALFARWLRHGLLAVSFVTPVVIETFVVAAAGAEAVVATDHGTAAAAPTTAAACGPVLALLFDELSFAYLQENGDVRPEFPALRAFSETATNYLDVRAPADETLRALPSYLAARHIDDLRVDGEGLVEVSDGRSRRYRGDVASGLFADARRLGFATEMAGYYLPYCELLGKLVDRCRSYSFYNASSVDAGFSPVRPLQTTLIMWPRQFPFGLVKNPPFARLQRALVSELAAFAGRPLDGERPVFRFVHFSIPHLPFVFGAEGYDPPMDPLRTAPDDSYVRQLHYVDRLVGDLVGKLEREGRFDRTTVVVLADHGFRFGGRERDKLHIPFLVKAAGQTRGRDVAGQRRGELLLRDVIEGACVPRS